MAPNYPIVLTTNDTVSVEITAPGSCGAGFGSVVNYKILGDNEI